MNQSQKQSDQLNIKVLKDRSKPPLPSVWTLQREKRKNRKKILKNNNGSIDSNQLTKKSVNGNDSFSVNSGIVWNINVPTENTTIISYTEQQLIPTLWISLENLSSYAN